MSEKIVDLRHCRSLAQLVSEASAAKAKYVIAGPFRVGAGRKREIPCLYVVGGKRCRTIRNVLTDRASDRRLIKKKYREDIECRARLMVANHKKRAQQLGIPFDLDATFVAEKIRAGKCEVSGVAFDLLTPLGPFSPTLDQRLAQGGYTKDNVQAVCRIYNLMKSNYAEADVRHFLTQAAANLT